MFKRFFYKISIIITLLLFFFIIFKQYKETNLLNKQYKLPYSQLINEVKKKNIISIKIKNNKILSIDKYGKKNKSYFLILDKNFINYLLKNNITFDFSKTKKSSSFFLKALIAWFPSFLLIILGVLLFLYIKKNNKKNNFSFLNSQAHLLNINENKINFSDIAGCNEAKNEVKEIIEFLHYPKKFKNLGIHIPRGILLIGPPGTGKTLLAKAIAGEAKVPFFTISGSNFVEMFVGIGASRVRNMFRNAKKKSPCIIFIDEIDAVGKKRGLNINNDEREQTLNQMLVEMDGFETNSGVIVIAATNRPEILDKALLRPGRFDRQVVISLPDIIGREQILNIYIKKIPISDDVKINILAKNTSGFSGADLSNLVNEAALFAARKNQIYVNMKNFEDAKDKIIIGAEKKFIIIDKEKKNIAYHEAGHTVVSKLLLNTDPIYKVSIIPRGKALGITWQIPRNDMINMYKNKMLDDISVLFGGRISEKMFTKNISTGAYNDFERATKIARNMVTRYGMSKLDNIIYKNYKENTLNKNEIISEITKEKIDIEIKKILDIQYNIAYNLLKNNKNKVKMIAKKLLELETLTSNQIDDIMNNIKKI